MSRTRITTQEMKDEICNRLIEGESLRKICKDDHLPVISVIMMELKRDEAFAEQYARARELQQEHLLEEIFTIADNTTDDVTLITTKEGNKEVIDHSAIQRAKLQVDTRKWAMSKLAPKKYGDKQTLDHNHNLTLAQQINELARERNPKSDPSDVEK